MSYQLDVTGPDKVTPMPMRSDLVATATKGMLVGFDGINTELVHSYEIKYPIGVLNNTPSNSNVTVDIWYRETSAYNGLTVGSYYFYSIATNTITTSPTNIKLGFAIATDKMFLTNTFNY